MRNQINKVVNRFWVLLRDFLKIVKTMPKKFTKRVNQTYDGNVSAVNQDITVTIQASLQEVGWVDSVLAREVEGDTKDNSRLKTIQGFLENCYELSSLSVVIQRLSAVSELQKQAGSYLNQAHFHCDRAREIIGYGSESDENGSLFLKEIEKCHLSIQDYRKIKTKEFELLRDVVDEFWPGLPPETQEVFEAWAKDLAIHVAEEEIEQQPNLALQKILESIPANWTVTAEEIMERLKQLVEDKDYENPIRARLNFIAAVFKKETELEKNTLESQADYEEDEQLILTLQLIDGATIQVEANELHQFMEENRDQVVVHHHRARGRRRTSKNNVA